MAIQHILITGGTGSFGSTMASRLLNDGRISKVTILSRDEKKQHDMRQQFSSPKIRFIVGDIRDYQAVDQAMEGVDVVFHAAALKQVPTGEFFPIELVKTNILGTHNVFQAAKKHHVKKVILLTTDKAVYPINAMGISKAMAEKVMIAESANSSQTVFCGVRYGNVMASRGSVIPLFVDAMLEGKNIKITDPLMTRFLLSLNDAIDLVDFAIQHGQQGDIFIQKAPAATIRDLGQALLNIFNSKSKIELIGTREGEKMHETLATYIELSKAHDMGKFYRISNILGQDYGRYYEKGKKRGSLKDYTSENTKRLSVKQIEKLLLSLDYIQQKLSK